MYYLLYFSRPLPSWLSAFSQHFPQPSSVRCPTLGPTFSFQGLDVCRLSEEPGRLIDQILDLGIGFRHVVIGKFLCQVRPHQMDFLVQPADFVTLFLRQPCADRDWFRTQGSGQVTGGNEPLHSIGLQLGIPELFQEALVFSSCQLNLQYACGETTTFRANG